jgi:hypothetical protein
MGQESWIAGHLYYHQSLNPLVKGFVHPLVVSLVKDGLINAFFFVRAGLGGPHLRLRLRVVPGAKEPALEAMQQSARRFLDLQPSTQSLEEEAIRRSNKAILAADPHEIDDAIYPNNSFQIMAFRPEIERYGGPSHFRASLDFFALSSVAAVEFLAQHGDALRSAQLTDAFQLLLQQALGFATDMNELSDLLRYGVDSWGEMMPKIVEKGDRVALSQRDVFLNLLHGSLAKMRSLPEDASGYLVLGASRLSAALATADRAVRAGIGGSQLHMTASRLGLSNAEEVYLSRLLTAILREEGGSIKLEASPGAAEGELSDLLSPALARLAEI